MRTLLLSPAGDIPLQEVDMKNLMHKLFLASLLEGGASRRRRKEGL